MAHSRSARRWLIGLLAGAVLPAAVAILLGMALGVGAFTFGYAEGSAYLKNDPEACANCHVMQGHYKAWLTSSHRNVAGCNDCHTPPHPLKKWLVKADNGFWHSWAFTTGDFHEPIRIKERNAHVTRQACVHCHMDFVHATLMSSNEDLPDCIQCHDDVGHPLR